MGKLEQMNDRISYVISMSGLTKSAFAEKINVSQPYISALCIGKKNPSDRTIADICREFHIDEIWLRTGEGEMQRERSKQEEIAEYMASLLGGERTETEEVLIRVISRMRPEHWNLVDQIIKIVREETEKNKSTEN